MRTAAPACTRPAARRRFGGLAAPLLLGAGLARPAAAAEWLIIGGEEPADAGVMPRPNGFLEAVGEGVVGGGSARGLPPELGDLEGEKPSFNHIGPGDATYGFSVKRARFGLRGVVPESGKAVTYAIAAEFGDNKLTRTEPVVLTDAAINVRVAPQAQLRLGQFKLPTAEEAVESNPQAAHFVNFTTGMESLMLESPVEDGHYSGGASGLRDVGLMAWGHQGIGEGGLSYALMFSNGRMGGLDVDDAKDLTGRLRATLWGRGDRRDPHREELAVFGWWQEGSRLIPVSGDPEQEEARRRMRRGAGLNLQLHGLHLRSELIDAEGVIDAGYRLPFSGQDVVILPTGQGTATNTFAHYTAEVGHHAHLGGGLRYDRYRRQSDRPTDERLYSTTTLNATIGYGAHVHLHLDYELREAHAPNSAADTERLLATMGDRASGELVISF